MSMLSSLDKYMGDVSLTWMKRLKMCVHVASGLDFLHITGVMQDMVRHKEMKWMKNSLFMNMHLTRVSINIWNSLVLFC